MRDVLMQRVGANIVMKFPAIVLGLGFVLAASHDTAHAGRFRLATELDRPLYEQECGLSVAAVEVGQAAAPGGRSRGGV
jgi:hypothetical protein